MGLVQTTHRSWKVPLVPVALIVNDIMDINPMVRAPTDPNIIFVILMPVFTRLQMPQELNEVGFDEKSNVISGKYG